MLWHKTIRYYNNDIKIVKTELNNRMKEHYLYGQLKENGSEIEGNNWRVSARDNANP
jgi:hypothetical protein